MMKLPRRSFLHLAAGAIAVPAVNRIATAQTWPSRPVRLFIPYPPGGGTDIATRLITPWLTERLGEPFIIEYRPGAATNIATEALIRSPPDGYTLLMLDVSPTINATLYNKLSFNFIRDVAPVACVIRTPLIVVVNPSVPAQTVAEFIDYARSRPGKVDMASAGTGTVSHIAGELFKIMTGVAMTHVPYRGGAPALTDLIGGHVQVYFSGTQAIENIRSGQARALAITSALPLEALPGVPTVDESVAGYEASTWYGMVAPKETPPDVIGRLNSEINVGLARPGMKARCSEIGGSLFVGSPAAFGKLIADDTEKWAKVIRAANIRL